MRERERAIQPHNANSNEFWMMVAPQLTHHGKRCELLRFERGMLSRSESNGNEFAMSTTMRTPPPPKGKWGKTKQKMEERFLDHTTWRSAQKTDALLHIPKINFSRWVGVGGGWGGGGFLGLISCSVGQYQDIMWLQVHHRKTIIGTDVKLTYADWRLCRAATQLLRSASVCTPWVLAWLEDTLWRDLNI